MEFEKGLAANTILSYRQELEKFFAFLEAKAPGLSAPGAKMTSWISSASEGRQGGAVSSQAHLISVLKSFYRYLLQDELLDSSPVAAVALPKKWLAAAQLSRRMEEVSRLLDTPDISTVIGKRDKAILELMYATGLRISEVAQLKPADVYLDEGFLRVLRQGRQGTDRAFRRDCPRLPCGTTWRTAVPLLVQGGRPPTDFFELQRRGVQPPGAVEDDQGLRAKVGLAGRLTPACAAPFVRHPPGGERGRPALGADAARPFIHHHHRDLHPPGQGPGEKNL